MCDRFACTLLAIVLAMLSPSTSGAQLWADLFVGHASHPGLPTSADLAGASVGVRYTGNVHFELATGFPIGSGGGPWAASGLAVGTDLWRGASVGLRSEAQAYRVAAAQGPASWVTMVKLEPGLMMDLPAPSFSVELRSGQTWFWNEGEGEAATRRVSAHSAHLHLGGSAPLYGEVTARYVLSSGTGHPYFGAYLEAAVTPMLLWTRVGRWTSEETGGSEWALGASIALAPGVQLSASVGHDPMDPIFWNPPRRTWSAGLSYALGGRTRRIPSSRAVEVRGREVIFRVPADEVGPRPSIGGTFTGWEPRPMQRDDGHWVAVFTLQPGVYRFSLRAEDGTWILPPSITHRVPDGFGGENGLLVVE